ncbi:hypothetical protein V5O48_017403 [Marasmius crinis-equi]|uniref:Uncharacterized protein n=1 Tax=Marasmius crinis-equi TaxID=585013 RepID=A0ABR3EP27_9AGAR
MELQEKHRDDAPDVYCDFHGFLAYFATWVEKEYISKIQKATVSGIPVLWSSLAITVLKTCKAVHGAGVYTSSDVFRLAGISPFLPDYEVFGNPSRCMHVACAYYVFVFPCRGDSQPKIWELVRRCIKGNLLAPTIQQRLEYQKFLAVYARDTVRGSEREQNLITNTKRIMEKFSTGDCAAITWSCHDLNVHLWDCFEPTNIKAAFEHTGFCDSIGSTIFGSNKWAQLGGTYGPSTVDDPLTEMFWRNGALFSSSVCPITHEPDFTIPKACMNIVPFCLMTTKHYL